VVGKRESPVVWRTVFWRDHKKDIQWAVEKAEWWVAMKVGM
jgi:hypothetical protein